MSDETRDYVKTAQGIMIKVSTPPPEDGLEPQVRYEGPVSLARINDNLAKIKDAIDTKEKEIEEHRARYLQLKTIRDETESLEFPAAT